MFFSHWQRGCAPLANHDLVIQHPEVELSVFCLRIQRGPTVVLRPRFEEMYPEDRSRCHNIGPTCPASRYDFRQTRQIGSYPVYLLCPSEGETKGYDFVEDEEDAEYVGDVAGRALRART